MRPKQILVVDDEPAITSALATLLKQAGYEVTMAHSGSEALALLPSQPDLVILDIMMPGMDGYEVCRKIRQSLSYLPILMLTAKDELRDKVFGLELGADAYLTKPFAPDELLAQIRALFRTVEQSTRPGDDPLLACGLLKLWGEQHRVEVAGVEVELTPKEFELLRLFMRQPGRVFGRETLLRQVWGYDFTGDTRTVDVHIQRLRAKIETDPAQPQRICTVRGFGYRLVCPAS